MPAEREELLRLRRYNRDLAACLALPALWGGRDPHYIAETLLDVLISLLALDFAHLRVDTPGFQPFEATRPLGTPLSLGAAVDFATWADDSEIGAHKSDDADLQHLRFLSVRLGQPAVFGIVVAGTTRSDFPSERDRFLLRAACNQAAIALRNAFLVRAEKAARSESEAANRAKDQFFAMLSHELRNPLSAIGMAAAAMKDASERIPQLRDMIERQTHHLSRIIDDLLDVSRMTHGKIAIERCSIDLKEVVDAALTALQETGKLDHHRLETSIAHAQVDGDPARLSQVFINLLENAIKYTPRGRRVRVELRCDGEHALLIVEDDGIGIPADLLPKIFEPFVQKSQALDRAYGGLGLGLTVVKRLVEMHGGEVHVTSGRDGSRFLVRLPRREISVSLEAPRTSGALLVARRRVLIVEDNEDARESLRLLLEKHGHAVEEASDGNEGIEKLLGARPDVALVDLGLPGLDGFSVARAVRASLLGESVYLVALTGYGQPQDRRRALEAGFDEHLVKPVDVSRLLGVISTLRQSG